MPDESVQEITAKLLADMVEKHSLDNPDELEGDNEEIFDENQKTQALTSEDIRKIKNDCDEQAVIDEITRNNKNFEKKNDLTKLKYIEKKMKKHTIHFGIERVSLSGLVNYFIEHKRDFVFPREDYFAQFINAFDIGRRQRVMLFERASGVVLAGVLSRAPHNFEGKVLLADVRGTADPKRYEATKFLGLQSLRHCTKFLKKDEPSGPQVDWLGLALDSHEKAALLAGISCLANGGTLVAFARCVEVARQLVDTILASKSFVDIRTTEYFYRKFQILPMRSRPTMKGNMMSGYLITAVKVDKKQPENSKEKSN